MSLLAPNFKDTFVCECEEWMRSACAAEGFYDYHGKYCVLHSPYEDKGDHFLPALQKKLDAGDFNFGGARFPTMSFEGFEFESDVDFRFATFSDNVSFYKTRFSGQADFENATFSGEADFRFAVFEQRTNFFGAVFNSAAAYGDAEFKASTFFSSVIFHTGTSFGSTIFDSETYFGGTTFGATADFFGVRFNADAFFAESSFAAPSDFSCGVFGGETSFDDVVFNADVKFNTGSFKAQADFKKTIFKTEVDFSYVDFGAAVNFGMATFGDYVKFSGDDETEAFPESSSLDLQHARLEKPERCSFHTLTLHPHWFVNVDPRKFDFTNVEWVNSGNAKAELDHLKQKEVPSAHRLLAIASRRLAANAEENDRYRQASHFRRMSLDAERLERWRGFGFLQLSWWYWLASGYGERPFQALLVLLGLFLVFALLYTQVGFVRWEPRVASEADAVSATPDRVGTPLRLNRALTYSAGVMTLQRPEPRPATATAQTLVLLETILGPVQAALMALAIRRKFMR